MLHNARLRDGDKNKVLKLRRKFKKQNDISMDIIGKGRNNLKLFCVI